MACELYLILQGKNEHIFHSLVWVEANWSYNNLG